jgi:hypothetical protein
MSGIPNAATAATWGDRPPARPTNRDARSAERPVFEIGATRVNPSRSNLLAKATVTNHRRGQTLVFALLETSRPFGA